jgi:hypothetical protein
MSLHHISRTGREPAVVLNSQRALAILRKRSRALRRRGLTLGSLHYLEKYLVAVTIDPKKTMADVAGMCGVSRKTVHLHLKRCADAGLMVRIGRMWVPMLETWVRLDEKAARQRLEASKCPFPRPKSPRVTPPVTHNRTDTLEDLFREVSRSGARLDQQSNDEWLAEVRRRRGYSH